MPDETVHEQLAEMHARLRAERRRAGGCAVAQAALDFPVQGNLPGWWAVLPQLPTEGRLSLLRQLWQGRPPLYQCELSCLHAW